MRLDGKAALITGAGKGLGRAIALGLARAGADVALVSRTRKDLESLADEVRGLGRRALVAVADVTRSTEVDAAVAGTLEELGRLDVVVHSAGGSLRKASLEVTDADWDYVIAANLTSTFLVCRTVGKVLTAQRSGSIINIASAAGLRGRPTNAPYSAAKAGVINLSRAFAMEWAGMGVRVNVIAPGRFLTPLTAAEMSDPAAYAAFVTKVPLGRIGRPEELEEISVWLASDASSFVTGSVLVIDGGQTLA
jgi:2-deoxy-D-gluconate 3-dehydrogenase